MRRARALASIALLGAAAACDRAGGPPPAPAPRDAAADERAAALAEARALLVVALDADPPRAMRLIEEAFGAAPSEPEAAFLLAQAAFRSDDARRCEIALDAYLAKPAADHREWTAEAWVLLGWLRERAGDPEGALPSYDRALEIEPAYAWAMHRKGCAHGDLGDDAAEIEWQERAIARRPGLLEAHFRLAQALARAGRAEEAAREREIHRLLNQTSDNTARTPASMQERYDAYEQLERLLPRWLEGRLQLTRAQMATQRSAVALERMRRLIREHPDSGEAWTLLLELLRRETAIEQARAEVATLIATIEGIPPAQREALERFAKQGGGG